MSEARYKVVELLTVNEEELERRMNEAATDGWQLDRIDYVKEAGVRRPQMAFLFFVRGR